MKTNELIKKHAAPLCVVCEINNGLTRTKKIYTDRGNYAASTVAWLRRNFGIVDFQSANDAPRGGKRGNFLKFEPTDSWIQFCEEWESAVNAEESARKVATNMSAAKLGFYSSEGARKFMDLIK